MPTTLKSYGFFHDYEQFKAQVSPHCDNGVNDMFFTECVNYEKNAHYLAELKIGEHTYAISLAGKADADYSKPIINHWALGSSKDDTSIDWVDGKPKSEFAEAWPTITAEAQTMQISLYKYEDVYDPNTYPTQKTGLMTVAGAPAANLGMSVSNTTNVQASVSIVKYLDKQGLAHFYDKLKGIFVTPDQVQAEILKDVPVATLEKVGTVKPDGTTMTVDGDGTLHATQPDLTHYVQDSAIEDMQTKTDADAKFATKEDISSVYTPKGQKTAEELTADLLVADNVGDVYNVTTKITTDENYLEGAGSEYPVGTNVVIVEQDGSYKFDVLAGMIDLSGFATKDSVADVLTKTEAESIYVKQEQISAISNEEIDALFAE